LPLRAWETGASAGEERQATVGTIFRFKSEEAGSIAWLDEHRTLLRGGGDFLFAGQYAVGH
jgi:hypothetical protein